MSAQWHEEADVFRIGPQRVRALALRWTRGLEGTSHGLDLETRVPAGDKQRLESQSS